MSRYAHLADKTLRDAVNLSDQLQQKKESAIKLENRRNA